ncbi:MAG TPA: hypothetical protein VD965_01420 [Burkholderiales bacterium]|nr:hypothetical protein [Burkholderiales bacterium]
MPRKAPFSFVEVPDHGGLTMMVDFGLPYRYAEDVVELAGDRGPARRARRRGT